MYIFTQLITLGLFNKDIMNIITTNIVSIKGIKMYIIYNIIYYFIGKWQLEKGINID